MAPCHQECRAYTNKQRNHSKRDSDDQADVRGAYIRVLDGPALELKLFVFFVLDLHFFRE
jgi:hypothetical protein